MLKQLTDYLFSAKIASRFFRIFALRDSPQLLKSITALKNRLMEAMVLSYIKKDLDLKME